MSTITEPRASIPPEEAPDRRPVATHRALAVTCALVCFAPLGVAAVVQSGHVSTRLALGDLAGARRAARTTARLCWASVLVTVAMLLLVVLLATPYSREH